MDQKGILWPAVGEVWRGRAVALRVIWLPFVLSTLAYELYYMAWPLGFALTLTMLEFLLFSWAAVGWHRAALLGERPGPLGTRSGGPVPRYAFGWFAAALVAGIIGIVTFMLCLTVWGQLGFSPGGWEPSLTYLAASPLSFIAANPLLMCLGIGSMWLMIYLFFHFARALPALAIRRDGAWHDKLRRARRRWFASAAAWSLLLWVPVVAVYYAAYGWLMGRHEALWDAGQEGLPLWAFSALDTALNVVYALNVVIGASVLTIAFRRTASFDDGPDEGARL